MDFAYTAEDEAFREELERWLDEHLPAFLRQWGESDADGAEGGDDESGGKKGKGGSRKSSGADKF